MVTRPCLCGLDRWPGRLCGFTDKAADGAPRWTTGLVSPGQVGVPPAPDSLTLTAGRATGEIQGQSPGLPFPQPYPATLYVGATLRATPPNGHGARRGIWR